MKFPLHPETPASRALAILCAAQFALFAPAHVFLFADMMPLDMLVAALVTGAMFALWRRGGLVSTAILGAALVPVWTPPAILYFDAYPWACAAALAVAVGAAATVRQKPFVRLLSAGLVFAAGMAACTLWTMLPPGEDDFARLRASLGDAGRLVFDARTRPDYDHIRHVRVDPTRRRLFVSRGFDWESKRDGVFAIDLDTGAITPIGATPAQAMVIDPERRRLLVGHFRSGRLVAYDLDTLAPVADAPIRRPILFIPDREGRSFWMLGERHPVVTRWGFEGLYPIVPSANLGRLLAADMTVSEERGLAWTASNRMSPFNRIVELDLERLAIRREASLGFAPTRSIVVDERRGVLYLAHPLPGSIEVLDLADLRYARSRSGVVGAYPLVYDPASDTLFVASYSTGQLLRIDAESGAVTWSAYVGRRARGLTLDAEHRTLYGTSALGVYLIDLERIASRALH